MFNKEEFIGAGSIMVWVRIALDARTELHVIDGNSLNRASYLQILQAFAVLFALFIGDGSLIMQDDTHTACKVIEYLDKVGTERLP